MSIFERILNIFGKKQLDIDKSLLCHNNRIYKCSNLIDSQNHTPNLKVPNYFILEDMSVLLGPESYKDLLELLSERKEINDSSLNQKYEKILGTETSLELLKGKKDINNEQLETFDNIFSLVDRAETIIYPVTNFLLRSVDVYSTNYLELYKKIREVYKPTQEEISKLKGGVDGEVNLFFLEFIYSNTLQILFLYLLQDLIFIGKGSDSVIYKNSKKQMSKLFSFIQKESLLDYKKIKTLKCSTDIIKIVQDYNNFLNSFKKNNYSKFDYKQLSNVTMLLISYLVLKYSNFLGDYLISIQYIDLLRTNKEKIETTITDTFIDKATFFGLRELS